MPTSSRFLSLAALAVLATSRANAPEECFPDTTSLLSGKPVLRSHQPLLRSRVGDSLDISHVESLPQTLADDAVETQAAADHSHVGLLGLSWPHVPGSNFTMPGMPRLNLSRPHLPHLHMPGVPHLNLTMPHLHMPFAGAIDHEALEHRGEFARENMGLHQNGAGDLSSFLTALMINTCVVVGMATAASFLRQQLPDVYSHNTLGQDPRVVVTDEEKSGLFGWIFAARRIIQSADLVEVSVGLDHCMLLEYTSLAMKIMLVVGLPHMLILAPLHQFFGGVNAHLGVDEETGLAIEPDRLSSIGFANVEVGSPVCWAHGFFVIFTVAVTQWLVFEAQGRFVTRRIAWLKRMPFPRSNTILVECIEDEYRSDKKLKEYFNHVFDEDCVDEAYVVRDTTNVLAIKSNLEENQRLLNEAQAAFRGSEPSARPRHRVITDFQLLGQEVDSIEFFTDKVRTLEEELAAEQARIQKVVADGELDNGLFCTSGFVTFKKRVNCEHALKHNFSADADTFVVSIPPHPNDISYPALQVDDQVETGRQLLGYAAVAGIFFCFLPLVVTIASLTSINNLSNWDFFAHVIVEHPGVKPVWDGMVSSLLLTILMGFVPTFLIMAFESFFSLKAEMWTQHKVQQWYFYFLVLFVLLVTGIGSSLASAFRELIADPSSIFWRLADAMPQTTHFYLNFFPTQMAAHVGFLTRNAPLGKYLAMRPILGAERAKELAEPEAQCFYGIGSRSATFSLLLVTALVFCTLSPLICVLCFVFFAVTRIVYANLFLFAETSKPDLGGVFWVTSLKHTQQGLFIYVLLMTGVLLHRAETCGPGCIAAASFAVLVPSYNRFDRAFLWESLPFASVQSAGAGELPSKWNSGSGDKTLALRYEQVELRGGAAAP